MVGKIIKLDHEGNGIALIDNLVTFVPKTIPGDIVEIKIKEKKKNYQTAEVVKIITKSPLRISAFCPYYDSCGGCQLQNYEYPITLNYKKEKILNIFSKLNYALDPIIISNPCNKNYRNKIELKVQNKKIGFYEKKTNNMVEIEYCPITNVKINEIIPLLKKLEINNGNIILRVNKNNDILVIIDTLDKISCKVLEKNENIKGIILNKKLIWGESFLEEEINNIKYKIEYDAFFQVNPYVTSTLFNLIKENISTNSKVLDLYCGVGAITLQVGSICKKALGIEIIPNAIKNALENKKLNNISNVNFCCGDVLKEIKKISNEYDTWIIDPPRKGLDKITIEILQKYLPTKIIYVSCNIHSLTRDLASILPNYEITKFYILDMFSYSHHVECLCILNKN